MKWIPIKGGKPLSTSPFITLLGRWFSWPLPMIPWNEPLWHETICVVCAHLCLQVLLFNSCLLASGVAGCAVVVHFLPLWPCTSLWGSIALRAVLHSRVRCCWSRWQTLLEPTSLQDLACKQNVETMTWKHKQQQQKQPTFYADMKCQLKRCSSVFCVHTCYLQN